MYATVILDLLPHYPNAHLFISSTLDSVRLLVMVFIGQSYATRLFIIWYFCLVRVKFTPMKVGMY